MSSPAAAAPFWRSAGMTYIAYSSTCASILRKCLKEPHKSQVDAREKVYYKVSKLENGDVTQTDIREFPPSE